MDDIHPSMLKRFKKFSNVMNLVTWFFAIFVQGFEFVYIRMGRKRKFAKMKVLYLHSFQAIYYFASKALIHIFSFY